MRSAVRAAGHAALAFGCVAGAATPAAAADWSLAPTVIWSADDDSNRYLQAESQASQSAAISASLQIERATETTRFSLTPHVDWRDFFTSSYGDVFERDVSASGGWSRDRGRLDITGEDADQSTLTTESTQTGILSTKLHQRSDSASIAATFDQSERSALVVQLAYSDISYYGVPEAALLNLLSGYRFPTGSLAERFSLSERTTLTASVFSSEILSRIPGNDINESGLQLDFARTLSERIRFDVSGGAVRMHSAAGSQMLPLGTLQLSRNWELSSLALSYSRSLTPYGTAALVQRQDWSLSASHNLTEKVDLTASLDRVQNSQPSRQPLAASQLALVQTYDSVLVGSDWRFAETWKLTGQVGATWTRTAELASRPVHEWRVAIDLSWTPHAFTTPLGP